MVETNTCATASVSSSASESSGGGPGPCGAGLPGYYRSSIKGVKLSVSVSDDDVVILDEYARTAGLGSRSAAVQHAIRLLRQVDLEQDYAAAWQDWESSGERAAWEGTVGDGLTDAAR